MSHDAPKLKLTELKDVKKKKTQKAAVNLSIDDSLSTIVTKLKEAGVQEKDFNKVILEGNYQSCCCDEYSCICDSAYSNLRFSYTKQV